MQQSKSNVQSGESRNENGQTSAEIYADLTRKLKATKDLQFGLRRTRTRQFKDFMTDGYHGKAAKASSFERKETQTLDEVANSDQFHTDNEEIDSIKTSESKRMRTDDEHSSS